MIIAVEQIMSWGPCDEYPKRRVEELIGDGKTPLEICKLDIPEEDRLWVLLREDIIPEKDLHELACKFAESALKAERKSGREPHPDSWNAIKVKRLWIKGKATDEELETAWAAAKAAKAAESAAWSTAESAARAAWSTAESAARATWSAAWVAARAAESTAWAIAWVAAESAESAAWATAWAAAKAAKAAESAERQKQLRMVKKYLVKNNIA